MQQPMDDASFQQDPGMMGGDPNAMGDDPNAMGIDPSMESGDPNATGGDQSGEDSDDTTSIINQLSDADKEAVRSYAKSMLNKSDSQQENGDDGNQPMMESVIFTKKQLNKIQENFGPSQDELMKKNDRKGLPKKISKSGSSPFNSPFA